MSNASDAYYVPHGSRWPLVGSLGLLVTVVGIGNYLNGKGDLWMTMMYAGLGILIFMMFGWFGAVIKEGRSGLYNAQVDRSFRMGMAWFIFSEVMFFAAFFGALFYSRHLGVAWLGGEGSGVATRQFLWPEFEAQWPTNGPAELGGYYEIIPAFGLPAINTLILLTSGVTITLAHHALRLNHRRSLLLWLLATIALGFGFVYLQALEYIHAYQDLNLKLSTGIFGSTFFMLTGFHGLHVTLGAIMLAVIWFRCLKGHFSREEHFGFEAVAWYWHFVDVVWLGLFLFVYIL